MRVLGIDPGIARLGWAVIDEKKGRQKVVGFGCIETPKGKPDAKRLTLLFGKLKKIIKKYRPEVMAVEDLFFAANVKTASRVGQARGVSLLAGALQKVPVKVYTPLKIKMAITGYGRAEKKQVQQMVKTILKLENVPKPDDTADALAVALTHCFTHKFDRKANSKFKMKNAKLKLKITN